MDTLSIEVSDGQAANTAESKSIMWAAESGNAVALLQWIGMVKIWSQSDFVREVLIFKDQNLRSS